MCEFQDLESGKRISNAKICTRLYLLRDEESKNKTLNNACTALVSSNNKDSVASYGTID